MIKFKNILIVPLLLLFCTSLSDLLIADVQGWINNSLSIKMNSNSSLKFSNEIRCHEITYMNPYFNNWVIGLGLNLPKNFSFGLSYKRENEEKSDFILAENRLYIDAGWKKKLSKSFDFDCRFRTEVRRFEKGMAENHLRFRFRVRLKTKVNIGSFRFKPFISTELWGDTKVDEVNRNRFFFGANFPLSEGFEFLVSYMRQDTRNKEVIHALNTGVELKF